MIQSLLTSFPETLAASSASGGVNFLLAGFLGLLGIVLAAVLLAYVAVPAAKGIGAVIRHLATFIWRTIADFLRGVGSLLLAIVYVPLTLGCVIIGRWSAARHYGNALTGELQNTLLSVYRVVVGNPARLFLLDGLTEGIEKRLPAVIAAAPTADAPAPLPSKANPLNTSSPQDQHNAHTSAPTSQLPPDHAPSSPRRGQFEGYVIVGSLPSGGSGAKLYVAEPDDVRAAAFARAGIDVGQVVIKSFSLTEGSSLPQIVRESRSLEAARKMGLILDHQLEAEKFYYVMRYVPGESLTLVTKQLHASSPAAVFNQAAGLGDPQLKAALQYVIDVVASLGAYHRGGLWHKDVKPDNIIVATRTDRRAHLVDFGLVSSLRSAMTLTTHGTEYFRDPELVRRALQGVKVHEVDGTRFDIFAAGAVLYSVIEDSFPAHGVLSQFAKRCPESIKWIVRRAMTDYDKRYSSAQAMLADLQYVALAADPFDVKPFSLPSVVAESGTDEKVTFEPASNPAVAAAASASPFPYASASPPPLPTPQAPGRSVPHIRVTNWWSGQVVVDGQHSETSPQGDEATSPSAAAKVDQAVAYAKRMAEQAVAAAQVGINGAAAAWSAKSPRPANAVPPPLPRQSPRRPLTDPSQRKPAAEQLRAARERALAARERARTRGRTAAPGHFRTGLHGGVMLTVCLLAGSLVGLGLLLTGGRSDSNSTFEPNIVVTYEDGSTQPTGRAATDESAAFATADSSADDDLDRSVRATSVGSATFPCTLLIINDLKQPWSPSTAQTIQSLISMLAQRGITIRGENPVAMGDLSETDISLVARLRLQVGQTPPSVKTFGTRIETWLTEQSNTTDPVSAVLWLAPQESSLEEPQIHAILAPLPNQRETRLCEKLPDWLQSALPQAH